jgi:hypothetical protein
LCFVFFSPPPTKLSRIGWSSTINACMYVCMSSSICCSPVDVPYLQSFLANY